MSVGSRKDMLEFFEDKKWDTHVVFDIEVSDSHQCIAMSSRNNTVLDQKPYRMMELAKMTKFQFSTFIFISTRYTFHTGNKEDSFSCQWGVPSVPSSACAKVTIEKKVEPNLSEDTPFSSASWCSLSYNSRPTKASRAA